MIDDPVNYSPYCPICDACGEDGCCSALSCQQHPDGDYCEGYLEELKISYRMNRFFQEKIYPHLTDEWQTLYDEQWDEEYERSRKGGRSRSQDGDAREKK